MSQTVYDEPTAPSAPPAAPASAAPRSLAQSYDRTWELELLISGAVAFALLQLPGAMDWGFEHLRVRAGEGMFTLALFGYIYGKVILYTLIATFLVHLAARAYWVGLIGLQSVFPGGVRWERTRYGPVTRQVHQERTPGIERQIAAVDRFCGVLFSFAALVVLIVAVTSVMALAMGAVAAWLSQRFFVEDRTTTIFFVLLLLWSLPVAVATGLDRWRGDRLPPAARRGVRSVAIGYYRMQLGSVTALITNTLSSNLPRRRANVLIYAVMLSLFGFFLVRDLLVRTGVLTFDGYTYLPAEAGPHSVSYEFYESKRPPDRPFARTPSIQSDVVSEPFVRLFIPYYPRRHNAVVMERCPGVPILQQGELRLLQPGLPSPGENAVQEVLRCLASLQPVKLNGEPRPDLRFHFYTQPHTDVRGIVTYIPTAELPTGENLLEVAPLPRAARQATRSRRFSEPFFIPFWVAR